jgi:hypothetical protein
MIFFTLSGLKANKVTFRPGHVGLTMSMLKCLSQGICPCPAVHPSLHPTPLAGLLLVKNKSHFSRFVSQQLYCYKTILYSQLIGQKSTGMTVRAKNKSVAPLMSEKLLYCLFIDVNILLVPVVLYCHL